MRREVPPPERNGAKTPVLSQAFTSIAHAEQAGEHTIHTAYRAENVKGGIPPVATGMVGNVE